MIITLSGRAGAGKDTAAEILLPLLQELMPAHNVRIEAFAAPLRTAARTAGIEQQYLDRAHKEVPTAIQPHLALLAAEQLCEAVDVPWKPQHFKDILEGFAKNGALSMSPRKFLQVLGTEGIRHQDSEAFVKRIRREGRDAVLLVPDCRFENELAASTVPLFVYRPLLSRVESHESERLGEILEQRYLAKGLPWVARIQAHGKHFHCINNFSDRDALQVECTLLARSLAA